MIKVGDIVKDKLSNFKGTAVARAEYLYGCVWVCVIPKELHEGKPVEDAWFDEQRLEAIVTKAKIPKEKVKEEKIRYHGGPMPSLPRHHHPRPGR